MSEEHLDLRPHQLKALRKLSNGKILWGGVGTGKSRVAATYYKEYEAPKHVYVITTAKKRDSFDWQEEFYRLGIGPATGPVLGTDVESKGRRRKAGVDHKIEPAIPEPGRSVGSSASAGRGSEEHSGHVLLGDGANPEGSRRGDHDQQSTSARWDAGIYPWVLTIDSWNNIAKYADVAGAFFIFDEQRLVGSGDWTRKFLRIAKHNRWILLSGTPGDTWMAYIPVFVANDFYKNRTAFKREHVVYNTFTKFPKVDRYINVGKLMRQRAQLLVEMPYERHTKRRIVEVPLKFDKEALEMVLKKRWHIYENRPLRDIAEMFSVGRRVVNSDRSRIEMVQELWQKHPKLIIFYNFNYELEILRSLNTVSSDAKTQMIGTSAKNIEEKKLSNRFTSESVVRSSKTSESMMTQNLLSDSTQMPSVEKSGMTSSGHLYHPKSVTGAGGDTTKSKTKFAGISTTTSPQTAMNTSVVGERDPRWKKQSPSKSSSERGFENGWNTTSSRLFGTSTTEHKGGSAEISSSGDLSVFETITSISEWNGHKHQPIPSTERWLYLVQYTAGAEGWNCIETDAMLMYSRNYSWTVTEQAYGRIDRLNTPFQDLWYYDFTSESFIDLAIGRSLKAKETFNEAKYARLFTS